MKESDVEFIVQRALEKCPEARPRTMGLNSFFGTSKTTSGWPEWPHVLPPKSNGKLEAFLMAPRVSTVLPHCPGSYEEEAIQIFFACCNAKRLHRGIDYVAPLDMLAGRAPQVFGTRDRKREAVREQLRIRRQKQRLAS